MQLLKQSTAITAKIGPFLDETNGKDAETGLTIAQADVRLSKNGGDIAQKNDATSCTHDELGIYGCPLNATDTGTLGRLQLFVHETGALPVWHEFMVLPANVYDSLVGGSDNLEVDTTQVGGTAQTANDMSGDVDTILSRIIGTLASGTHNPQSGDAYLIVNNASYGNAQLVRSTTPANTLDVNAAGEAGIDLDNTSGTLAKTADITGFNDLSAADVNAEVDTALADIHLDHLATRANTAQGGAAGYITLDASASSTNDLYNGQWVVVISGTAVGQARLITGYDGTSKQASVSPDWATNPVSGDGFVIFAHAGETMRGTDSAALASVCTETRLAELDAANLPSDIDAILADTGTDGVVLANDAITSAKIAADAIGASEFAQAAADKVWSTATRALTDKADFALSSTSRAAVADDVWDEVIETAHETDGTAGEHLNALAKDILARTNTNTLNGLLGVADSAGRDLAEQVWLETEDLTGDAHSYKRIMARLYAFFMHKMNITDSSGAVALRNTGDTADVMTNSITDNDTTTVRTEGSWTGF